LLDLCASGGSSNRVAAITLIATTAALRGEAGALPPRLMGLFPVPHQTAQRLSCDAAVTPLLVDERQNPLDLGRTVRTVAPAQRRAVAARDRTCRWPGCGRPVTWCQSHHLHPWADGGETNVNQLLSVCTPHHHLLHEGGWTMELSADGEVTVRPPPVRTAV
jgi:hypothetical protein